MCRFIRSVPRYVCVSFALCPDPLRSPFHPLCLGLGFWLPLGLGCLGFRVPVPLSSGVGLLAPLHPVPLFPSGSFCVPFIKACLHPCRTPLILCPDPPPGSLHPVCQPLSLSQTLPPCLNPFLRVSTPSAVSQPLPPCLNPFLRVSTPSSVSRPLPLCLNPCLCIWSPVPCVSSPSVSGTPPSSRCASFSGD